MFMQKNVKTRFWNDFIVEILSMKTIENTILEKTSFVFF